MAMELNKFPVTSPDIDTPPRSTNGAFKRRYPTAVVSYRECMRNHAASIGGHAIDGCNEFMPSSDPDSLNCAACGCHRNFHRRDPDDPTPIHCNPVPAATRSFFSGKNDAVKKRKRFRTRFTDSQKEKMFGFAEKLGWKLQRIDRKLIEEFCGEIGVGKEVLKVWMHNNKNTLGRREVGGGVFDGDLVEKMNNGGDFKPVNLSSSESG